MTMACTWPVLPWLTSWAWWTALCCAVLKLVRYCVKYNKRVIFPSTSEVYGMCQDQYFDEDTSNLVVGPINKQRWIYSVSKQLLDRVIWAYGAKGLNFTLFRPFNWMGPR